jgi:CBS domain-containing protein
MSVSSKVRTHKISAGAKLCVPGTYNQIGPDSPAIEAMTDFTRVSVVTIEPSATLANANASMIARGVRLLLVRGNDNEQLLGLITARDLLGERPLQLAQGRSIKPSELPVSELMVPAGHIDIVHYREVLHTRVVDVLDAMKAQGR